MHAKCPDCGERYNTKNTHACPPKPKITKLPTMPANTGRANSTIIIPDPSLDLSEDGRLSDPERERVQKWRSKNREHYNAKQREYQRAYRARLKEKKEQGNASA